MNQSQLEKFQSADWGAIESELLKYAEVKVRTKKWRSGSSLPKGLEAPDLVGIAITKTLNGILDDDDGNGKRVWNEQVNATLLEQLKDAIDSEVSNLVKSEEHKKNNYSASASQEDAQRMLENSVDSVVNTETHREEKRVEFEKFESFKERLYTALADNEDAMLVLMAYEELSKVSEVVKPQQAADKTGLSVVTVYNVMKRIKRAATKIEIEMSEEGLV